MHCQICDVDSESVTLTEPCQVCRDSIASCLAEYQDLTSDDVPTVEEEFDVGC